MYFISLCHVYRYPVEFLAKMEIFSVCTASTTGSWPHMAVDHMKCG